MLVSGAGGSLGGGKAASNAKRLQQLHEATTSGLGAGTGSGDRQLKAAFNYLRLIGEAFALRDNVLERAKEITKDLLVSKNATPDFCCRGAVSDFSPPSILANGSTEPDFVR